MKLTDWLSESRVTILECTGKEVVLDALLARFDGHPNIADFEKLAQGIRQREEALATGIGLGIAVPHVRTDAVRQAVAALAVLQTGVDWGALDGRPVQIVLMVAMPAGSHNQYLEYLARASRLFQQAPVRERLIACDSPHALWQALQER